MARPDPERVWLGFAQAALGGVMSIDVSVDPTTTQWSATNATICDDVAEMADLMLERWLLRYGPPDEKKKHAAEPEPTTPDPPSVNW